MKENMKVTIIFVSTLALAIAQTNYCASSLCDKGVTNIGCNNNGQFVKACPTGARIVNISPFISTILASHNQKRNQIAGGNLSGFQSAKRMATVQWDNQLAYLAELNVRQCEMRHDKCHNTPSFRYSGQNLGYFGYSGKESGFSDEYIIGNIIDNWWNEYRNANMNYINRYPSAYTGPTIGHFTVMVRENNIRAGCAISRFFDGTFNKFLLACNYATTNIVNRAVYASGTRASGCVKGRNPSYNNLCSTSETYDGLQSL